MRAGSSGCSCAEEYLVKSLSSAPRLESPLAWDFLAGISEGTAPPQRVLLPPEKIYMACQQTGSVRAGLYNLGNPCFLKSILQRLSAESREGGQDRSRAVPAPAVASSGPSCVPVSPGAGSAWGRGVRSAQRGAPSPPRAPGEAPWPQLQEVPGGGSPVAVRPRTVSCHKGRRRAGWS